MSKKRKNKYPNFPYNTIDYYARNSKERIIDLNNLESEELKIKGLEIKLKGMRVSILGGLVDLSNFLLNKEIVIEKTERFLVKEIPLRLKRIERISKDLEKEDGYSKKGFI